METIIVPHTKTNEEYRAALDKAKIEIERASGIKPGFVRTGTEYTWREDTLYDRLLSNWASRFFTCSDGPKQPDAPEVLCPCGSVTFTLRYGYYEIRARCTQCGTEDTVYDG